MKANQIKTLTLFVDLDGVLADLDKFVFETFGQRLTGNNRVDNPLWEKIHAMQESGEPTFSILDPMPDAYALWNRIEMYRPHILTATGKLYEYGTKEKNQWVRKNLTNHGRVFTVPTSKNKAQYARENHVLIDDRRKSIDPWQAAGGIGILHTSAAETVRELERLGL